MSKRFYVPHFATVVTVLLLLVICLCCASAAFPATGGVLPIAATEDWRTNACFRNVTDDVVAQTLGTYTFTEVDPRTGLSHTKTEVKTLNLRPRETRCVDRVDLAWNLGFHILRVDPKLEASVRVEYRDVASFEVSALTNGLHSSGEQRTFYRIASDVSVGTVAALVFLNLSSEPVLVAISTIDGLGREDGFDVEFIASGLTQITNKTDLPNGGTIRVVVGCNSCSGALADDLHVFISNGPASGKTQAIRYGE